MAAGGEARGGGRPPPARTRRKAYPTDLTGAEWERLAAHLPDGSTRGRPRSHPVREVLDAIFYVVRGGCAWRLLPHDFPPWGTVYYWFRRWRLDGLWQRILVALRRATRQREGRNPEPSAAIVDSQSVRIAEESGGIKGYDAAKNVPGRKRHLLVDTSRIAPCGQGDAGEHLGRSRRAGTARGARSPAAPPDARLGRRCLRGREAAGVVRGAGRMAA